jgi:hypothetical protein
VGVLLHALGAEPLLLLTASPEAYRDIREDVLRQRESRWLPILRKPAEVERPSDKPQTRLALFPHIPSYPQRKCFC